MTSGNLEDFFFLSMEILVMFSLISDCHGLPLPATHILQITGVMDWQELIMEPPSNRAFDYQWQNPPENTIIFNTWEAPHRPAKLMKDNQLIISILEIVLRLRNLI